MKALILDALSVGAGPQAAERVAAIVEDVYRKKAWDVLRLPVAEMEISPCRGCFHCWVRTPGICVINDAGRQVTEAWIGSDVVLLLSPISFGGYSAGLKKAVDRVIPILSPFFMKIRGEVHHRARYKQYPPLIGIGVLHHRDDEKEKLYSRIISRHAINVHSPWHRSIVLAGDHECRAVEHLIGPIAERQKEAA